MKKLGLVLLLAALLCFAFSAQAAAASSGSCGEAVTWTLDDNGLLTISGTGKMTDYNDSSNRSPFYSSKAVRQVVIEDGVTSIGSYAFKNCSNLESVSIPESVTVIGSYCFSECRSLTEIVLPQNLTRIGRNAFEYCVSLSSISIPAGANLDLPSGVSVYTIFYGCSSLAEIQVDENNPYVCSVDGVLFNKAKTKLFQYPRAKQTARFEAPGELKTIFDGAFAYNPYLTEVGLTDNVTAIGYEAFRECSSLKSVVLGNGVKTLPGRCFYKCGRLETVVLPNGLKTIEYEAFYTCASLKSIDLPDTLTSIKQDVFNSCGLLENIALPGLLSTLGERAFYNCSSLRSISVPSGVEHLEPNTFSQCENLSEVTISAYANRIDDNAFNNSGKVTIYGLSPSRAETFAQEKGIPFVCTGESTTLYKVVNGLIAAYYGGAREVVVPSVIDGVTITGIAGNAFYFLTYLDKVTLPESITSIETQAFYYCTSLKEISLPGGLKSISNYAFYKCTALERVTLPEGLTSLGYGAFGYCKALKEISLPEGLTSLGGYAFQYCTALEEVSLPEGLTKLGSYTFSECDALPEISIPASVREIDSYCFMNCNQLSKVRVLNDNVSFGTQVFRGCPFVVLMGNSGSTAQAYAESNSLRFTTMGDDFSVVNGELVSYSGSSSYVLVPSAYKGQTITSIGNNAFQNAAIEGIELPDTLTKIGDYAFDGCANLKEIRLPDGITQIGRYAFQNCTSLTKAELPRGLTSIWRYLFAGCSSLKSVKLYDNITSVGQYAFSGCTSLSSIVIPASVTSLDNGCFSSLTQPITVTLLNSTINFGNKTRDSFFKNSPNVTLCARKSSTTEKFANKYGIPFVEYVAHEYGEPEYTWDYESGTVTAAAQCSLHANEAPVTETAAYTRTLLAPTEEASGDLRLAAAFENELFAPQEIVTVIPALKDMDVLRLPAGLRFIESEAFSGLACEAVILPDGCESIGEGAFSGCDGLLYVELPASVSFIGENAFAQCPHVILNQLEP